MAYRTAAPIAQSSVATTTESSTSVTNASTAIVAANSGRAEITICNDHATAVVYLSLGGTAALNKGIRLAPAGGSYTTNAFSGAITGISTVNPSVVTWSEV